MQASSVLARRRNHSLLPLAASQQFKYRRLDRHAQHWPTILLLPASAECFVKLDEATVFISASCCQRQFGAVKRPLSVEHFEICRRAALVAKRGDADGFLQVGDRILLAGSDLMQFLVTDERIGNVAKCSLDRLSIPYESFSLLRLSQMQIPFQCASGKNRLAHLRAIGPDT